MSKRKKRTELSQTEVARFMADADALHNAICMPLIAPSGQHYRSLQKLHEALLAAIVEITGKDAPWAYKTTTGPAGWLKVTCPD